MATTSKKIALYPGDGIGVEVIEQAVRVLEAARPLGTDALALTHLDWGCDYHDQHGRVAPVDYLEQLEAFDAILLGAVGHPGRLPDHVTLEPLVGIRQGFDQYACVRPARTLPGVRSLLADPGTIDMAVVRENTEGEYLGVGGRVYRRQSHEIAIQTAVHSRRGIERILRFGFELARTRRHKLTMITKSNAMPFSMVLWDEVLEAIRPAYPDVQADRQHVDAACMNFVRQPDQFDVVVASNLFGDILTDLSGALVGSLGMNPSANLNPDRQFPSLFEPVHGSAPDIIGKGIANPVAAIFSTAMMLDWIGLKSAGNAIVQAVESALAAGHGTPDIGGSLGSEAMTDRIIERLADGVR